MALTTLQLRERMASQQWTSHNIRFNAEVTAMPGEPYFLETDLRLKALERILAAIYPESLKGLRVADLGSLEGGFALALALRGARVVAIEARSRNVEKIRLVREHFELADFEIVQGDVKDFSVERYGAFDVVMALGIAYHLDQPVPWLRQVARATTRLLFLDSHFAPADDSALKRIDPRLKALSSLRMLEESGKKYRGRWFREYSKGTDPEPHLWASYSNHESFWLTKESLLRAMRDSGFDLVFEQHDYSVDLYEHFALVFPRIMAAALKSDAAIRP